MSKTTHHWVCTWKEHEDFGCLVVLSPAVCAFTVERVTGVLACVSPGAVDHPQHAISLLLDCPAWSKEESFKNLNLHLRQFQQINTFSTFCLF